jgi:hypothetical protein
MWLELESSVSFGSKPTIISRLSGQIATAIRHLKQHSQDLVTRILVANNCFEPKTLADRVVRIGLPEKSARLQTAHARKIQCRPITESPGHKSFLLPLIVSPQILKFVSSHIKRFSESMNKPPLRRAIQNTN